MLAGRDSLAGIFRWGRRLRPKALEELGIRVGRAPCHATYHYVFRSLTVDDLEAALGAWVRDDAALGHAAIDGKSLRGSRDCEVSAVHLLAAFCARLKAVVGELRVPPDGNEITATAVDMWTTRCREFPHIPSAQQQPFPFEFRW